MIINDKSRTRIKKSRFILKKKKKRFQEPSACLLGDLVVRLTESGRPCDLLVKFFRLLVNTEANKWLL